MGRKTLPAVPSAHPSLRGGEARSPFPSSLPKDSLEGADSARAREYPSSVAMRSSGEALGPAGRAFRLAMALCCASPLPARGPCCPSAAPAVGATSPRASPRQASHGPRLVFFQVNSLDGTSNIGSIIRKWNGLVSAMADADHFDIHFPLDLDVRMKAMIFGACFLIVSLSALDFTSRRVI